MQQDVTAVYRSVIDNVITKVKPEFVQEGVDEAVLDELRVLWEQKLLASGALDPPPQAAQDLRYARPIDQGSYTGSTATGQPVGTESRKRTRDYDEQVPSLSQPQTVTSAPAQPQFAQAPVQHYRVPQPQPPGQPALQLLQQHLQPQQPQPAPPSSQAGTRIPQQDGPGDDADEEQAAAKTPAQELGNLSDLESDSDEEQPANTVLAQFEKVQRTKNRWKCNLIHGVMNLNGRDYLFNKANGEMQF
ncbi:hypothetical protein WJX72_004774 [[Myrmecia] bisecta]|uniref:Uncharacterized protein n=1 Tax=[Myrmecia] bisecta TaxID=41462 RepID=A0AAW1QRE3_9CHLO